VKIAIVDRWLAGRFARAYLVFASSATFMFLVIDLFSNMDSLLRHGLLKGLMERYGTMLPELFFTLSPHLVLVAGLWVVASLIRNNELVPLYASGYSPRRICAPILILAGLLGVLAWADRELLLPRLGDLRRSRRLLRQPREPVRPVPDDSGGVLAALFYLPHQEELVQPSFVRLDDAGGELLTVQGARAKYDAQAGGWRFFEGRRIQAASVGTGTLIVDLPPEGELVLTRIRKRDLEAAITAPGYLSSAQLHEQIERSPAFKHLEIQLYERFTQPLAGVALLLLGLPVILGAARGGNLYLRGLACVGLGIAYFFASAICFELGSHGVLPPILGASLPLLCACVVGGVAFARPR
jgi:lipopolysaccharide export LptBFGC system permease protein LptF